eukprot:CAMPEP_0206519742 /NCGR_PEP_ID=MMETSP0324_2-20121206/65382_1 /ASSEMBLY_ACC=CAM_ASM_000836 /TAXON_ID=2866 /ORGANISM="Crypthecodinium cohnii, Strain Seligo" /LENGTH=303 /DNA_ID=CAMNT_0054013401 /DNA_START=149 /DNA_END=1060 /DNA_ORIENTATION=+
MAEAASQPTSVSEKQLHIETPLVRSRSLSAKLGAEVYLKLDCLQPSGSFKLRGIGHTVRTAVMNGAKVLPSTSPPVAHKLLSELGAKVVVHGDVFDEADKYAREFTIAQNGCYVHPFDQDSTWRGHATLVEELANQLPEAPDAIVTCAGGGGLVMGILQGLELVGWQDTTKVICSETLGAASLYRSLEAKELVTLPAITSVAKSLGALRVSETVFKKCLERSSVGLLVSHLVSDQEAVTACVRLANEARLLVEPACGAALACAEFKAPGLDGCKTIVIEVCGGSLIDVATLNNLIYTIGVVKE